MQLQHSPIFSLKQTLEYTGNNMRHRVTHMTVATNTSALKSASAGGLSALIEAAKTRFDRYRMYRQTVNELASLSDRELADLGLHRSMIRRIATQATEENAVR